jgi:hypothetical protein
MALKDTWDARINKLFLDRLEERVALLYRLGRYQEAAKTAEKAVQTASNIYGLEHPCTVACLNNLDMMKKAYMSEIEFEQGKYTGMESLSTAVQTGKKSYTRLAVVFTLVLLVSVGIIGRYMFFEPEKAQTVYASTFLASSSSRPYYKVKASFFPIQNTIEGEEEVIFECREPVEEIKFNLYFNRYKDNGLNSSEMRSYALQHGYDQGYIEIQWVSYQGQTVPFQQKGQLLTVSLKDRFFSPGEHSLKMGFKVKIPLIADRSGGNAYGIWLGNWLPTINVDSGQVRPTEIGDPFVNLSATYELELAVPRTFTPVLNGLSYSEEKNGMKIYRGTLERVRDLPLFLNKSYAKARTTDGETEINYYYYDSGDHAREVLAAAQKAMFFFKQKVGEYPWKQLNIVENDMFLNGMEYSTLVLISSKAVQNSLEETIIHEVGHQWFYNIVGSDQYDAPYLDEGLVEFFVSNGINTRRPGFQPIGVKLNRNVTEFGTWQEYREVHYRKGRVFYENLYSLMGKNEFEKFIKEYYDRYKFGFVTPDEFRTLVDGKLDGQSARKLFE